MQSAITLVAGVGLGLGVVVFESGGVTAAPAILGLAVLLAGFAAGFAPIGIGFVFVAVLAGHQGFITDFVGGPARYWKEAYVIALVVRAARVQRPSLTVVLAFSVTGVVFLLYGVFDGSTTPQLSWGAKLLTQFAFAIWAIAVLRPTAKDKRLLVQGLFLVAASSLVVAVWQRSLGFDGLLALGFEFGEQVKGGNGNVRAFAGFLYHAPYAYTMALTLLIWFAFALSGDSAYARAWCWVPVVATFGLTLTVSRTAFVGIAAAIVIVALRRGQIVHLLAVGLVVAIVGLSALSGSTVSYIAQGFTFTSTSADSRTVSWSARLGDVSVFGEGVATAGAAALRADSRAGASSASALSSNGTVLAGDAVDNQYISWMFQYGILVGGTLCLAFLAFCLGPLMGSSRSASPWLVAAQLTGVFAVVAAFPINVWEEFPANFILALTITFGWLEIGLRRS